MKLKISEITEEGTEIEDSEKSNWFGPLVRDVFRESFLPANAAKIHFYVQKTCDNISIKGFAEIHLSPSCDRCLDSFSKQLEIPLRMNLSPSQSTNKEEESFTKEDMEFSFYKGEEINLDELIREILILDLPICNLCREECKGLCPHCGQNLNLKTCSCKPSQHDSRFDVLKNFKKKF